MILRSEEMEYGVHKIPILELKSQYKEIKGEIYEAIYRVLDKQDFILGEEVESLENEIAEYCGVKYAVGVSSGTDALTVALMALGIKQGDEVITTPYTFFSTSSAIIRLGAIPVYVDIKPGTFSMDVDMVERHINKRTKLILPVHFAGQIYGMDKLKEISSFYSIPIVEDACQSIGSTYNGNKAGSIGDIGCFSFYPSKNLGGYGDSGMCVTNNKELADKMRVLRNHGQDPRDSHKYMSGNYRMDELQACVLRVKLKHLDEWIEKRRDHAHLYKQLFYEYKSNIMTPEEYDGHTFHLFLILSSKRYRLIESLNLAGIGYGLYYPTPLHLQPCLKYLGYKEGDFPESESASLENLALPVYPELTNRDIMYIAETIHGASI
jgi:dTDP-4-amino-4,6-dideoxygalactose transaminase